MPSLRLQLAGVRWITILALSVALIGLALSRTPLLDNGDDHIRYYLGGVLVLRPDLGPYIAETAARLPDREAARLLMGATNWSPLLLIGTVIGESLRPLFGPHVQPVAWVLGWASVWWLLLLAVCLPLAWATLRPVPFAWLLAAIIVARILYPHTSPLGPEPRSIAVLATGIGLGAWGLGASLRAVAAWLLLAILAHPNEQALNLAVGLPIALLLRPELPRWTRLALLSVGSLALCVGLMRLLFPSPLPIEQTYGLVVSLNFLINWDVNRPALTMQAIALPVVFVVEVLYGHRRALLCAALAVVSLGVPSLLVQSIYYPGDPIERIGGAWNAALLAVLLQYPRLALPFIRLSPRLPATALLLAASVLALWMEPSYRGVSATLRDYQTTSAHYWGPVERLILDLLSP